MQSMYYIGLDVHKKTIKLPSTDVERERKIAFYISKEPSEGERERKILVPVHFSLAGKGEDRLVAERVPVSRGVYELGRVGHHHGGHDDREMRLLRLAAPSQLQNTNSNLCFDTGGSASFTVLIQSPYSTSNTQKFTLTAAP